MRRFMDIVVIFIIFPFLMPIIVFLYTLKLIIDGKPVFYNSNRIGRDNIPFKVYKFRTMVDDPDFIKNEILKLNGKGFEAIPLSNPVYTKIGRIYERYQFVEIPQLINIIKGDMSFIGYRPLPSGHLDFLSSNISSSLVSARSKYCPGITGFAQLSGKANLDSKQRLRIEVAEGEYFENARNIEIFFVYLFMMVFTLVYVLSGYNNLVIYLRDKLLLTRIDHSD